MIHVLASLAVAAYLLLCIILGGSAQGTWTNLALQLLGILLIGWAAVSRRSAAAGRPPVVPYALLFAGLVVILLQLIPLPPSMWQSLPGREAIAEGYRLLGYRLPALPVSVTPHLSVMTLFAAIPAIASFIAVERLRPSPRMIAGLVMIGIVLGTMAGALQVAMGPLSWAYPYEITNPGAVGFFANRNHMATLLLIGIPLTAALFASSKGARGYSAGSGAIAVAFLLVVALGVLMNRSFAAYGLVIPVALASIAIIPAAAAWRKIALPVALLALVGGVAFLVSNPIAADPNSEVSTSIGGRAEIWEKTVEAVETSFPVGTGLGSFQQVYRGYENPDEVARHYVNHAHNDYLELVLELGVAGAVLILCFLAWWLVTVANIWRSPLSSPFARAATIVSAIVLAHSIVDFPLRTAAISAIFAASLALMAHTLRSAAVARAGEPRPTRHVKIG